MMHEDTRADEIVVAAFYRFLSLPGCAELKPALLACCRALGLKGTILLAPEGINGTVAGTRQGIDRLFDWFGRHPAIGPVPRKESTHAAAPFGRMKVKLKTEIVTLGVADVNVVEHTGRHVAPEDWNEVIADPDTLVIDTRNRYEVHLGSFEGAVDPQTESFRDFPAWAERHLDPARHGRIAMFCTGGIRCEKATAWLREQGFEDVVQLAGGILNYLQRVPSAQSRWRGECFVFDDRVAVDQELRACEHEICPNCRIPIGPGEKALPEYEENVSCIHCHHRTDERRRAALSERHRQQALARQRQA